MKEIDILRTVIMVLVSVGGIIAAYFKTINKLEHKFRDKIEDQNKHISEIKIELEKLKSKDEIQQQIIDQLKTQVIDNLPNLYKAFQKNK